jgi:hypothetical protein
MQKKTQNIENIATNTRESEGNAGVCRYEWMICSIPEQFGKRAKGRGMGKNGRIDADKWFDYDIVRNRAIRRADGKLGVMERRKFRLWRQFSGLSFDELEDLVPLRDMVSGEYFEMASVYWLVMMRFTGGEKGKWQFQWRDVGMLFLMYRFETANGGSLFVRAMLEYSVAHKSSLTHSKGRKIMLTLDWIKRMRSRGLIEQIPGLKVFEGRKIAMFRLSPDGRMLLRQILEAFREVHKDIRYWAKNSDDKEYLARLVARFSLGVDEQACAGDKQTFEEMLDITKKDLRAMGLYKLKRGQKPQWWDDLVD